MTSGRFGEGYSAAGGQLRAVGPQKSLPKTDNCVPREGPWKTANLRGNVCLQCYEPTVSMRQVAPITKA